MRSMHASAVTVTPPSCVISFADTVRSQWAISLCSSTEVPQTRPAAALGPTRGFAGNGIIETRAKGFPVSSSCHFKAKQLQTTLAKGSENCNGKATENAIRAVGVFPRLLGRR